MKLAEFDYQLPKELIAQIPLKERSTSRLMVVDRKSKEILNRKFSNLLDYIREGDCLILNDTLVLPARILGQRATGGKVEILLLEKMQKDTFRCLVKPSKVKVNEKIILNGEGVCAQVLSKSATGNLVRLEAKEDIESLIKRIGVMPLPPYIKRAAQNFDKETYQTVYAKIPGAVASPTAGLHFTQDLLKKIREQGAKIAFLTLHVGWGTFKPVKAEDVASHKMEEEEFSLSNETSDLINRTKSEGGRVFSVGTTTTRVLETVAAAGKLASRQGKTGLYIYPGFKFRVVDCLLTNFHLPKSTLFLLACAFAGRDLMFKAYEEAIREKYRFYSYGDAMLIL